MTPVQTITRCRALIAIGVLGAAGASAQAQRIAPAPESDPRAAVVEAMGLADGTIVQLDLENIAVGDRFTVSVPGGLRGEAVEVRFAPNDIRAAGYQVVEDRGPDGLFAVDAGPARTVSGDAPLVADSTIRGSLLEDGLHAVFRWPDGRIQWIEPVGKFVDGFAPSLHVFYDNEAIPPTGGTCGTPSPILGRADVGPPPPVDVMAQGAEIYCAELACDADWEYYQDYGQSSANVQNRIELIINTCNAQYVSQTAIQHDITQIIIRTSSSDPYTSNEATTLLCQFITEWTNNQGSVPRDVAHLFTGRSINGGTIGIAADLGDICDNSGACSGPILYDGAYCLSESDCCGSLGCATDLTTHELGHLWDAFHCSCPSNTMNPSITCSNSFSSGTINSIISHRNSRSCLDICDGGGGGGGYCTASCSDLTYEFIASVELPGTGIARTSGSSGYADYTGDIGQVSPGQSVAIEIVNGDPQWVDDILAVYIDWNADEDFSDPGEEVATGAGVGPYNLSFAVPADQPEGQTRMRIRLHDGGFDAMAPCGVAQYGEVEDYTIEVVAGSDPCTGDVNGDGQVDAADLGLLVGAWGTCTGSSCPADINDDGRVDAADLGLLVGAWGPCSG